MRTRCLVLALLAVLALPMLAEEGPIPPRAAPASSAELDPAQLDPVLDLSPLDDAIAMCSPGYNQCTAYCDETVDPNDPYAWVCYQYCLCWYCGAICP
ncbi:MAG TPA: hypothetical protein VF017_09450 [Thermoanaerobaculia bacterium]|nr:hypothetical protein [Thermoanaerobaculia bacterium]